MNLEEYKIDLNRLASAIHCNYYSAQYSDGYESDEVKSKKTNEERELFLSFMAKWLPEMYGEATPSQSGSPGLDAMEQIYEDLRNELTLLFQKMVREKFSKLTSQGCR